MTHSGQECRSQGSLKWLQQRAFGQPKAQNPATSKDQVHSIKLEAKLEGHTGCVNCLDWNSLGDLLASGSDDCKVNIWRPFVRPITRSQIDTGHEGNIFSVKFVPQTNDSIIATCASDGCVKLTDVLAKENILNCNACHSTRVKRVAVHPNQPDLIWSAGEDGCVMEFDRRQRHLCKTSTIMSKNLLIDLNSGGIGQPLTAKCLALNPMRAEMIAIGSNDVNIRLFDRRYVSNRRDSSTLQFSAGHLRDGRPGYWSPGTTYLSFSSDGSELLANIRTDQVYLFNTYEPQKRFQSYDSDIRPILNSQLSQTPWDCDGQNWSYIKPRCIWLDLAKAKGNKVSYDDEFCESLYVDLKKKCDVIEKKQSSKKILDQINDHLASHEDCHRLYIVRASALINRGLQGDYYQAIRDACCALALKPDDPYYANILAIALHSNDDKIPASDLMLYLQGGDELVDESNRQRSCANFDQNMTYNFEREINMLMSNNNYWNGNFKTNTTDAFDYTRRYNGHCHYNTDIKEANFFGQDGDYIVAGSDDGAFYIWEKKTTNLVKAVSGDLSILNCLQAHPSICMLATSGIEPSVKLWSPIGRSCHDVKQLEQRCIQNQAFTSNDPLAAMYSSIFPLGTQEDGW